MNRCFLRRKIKSERTRWNTKIFLINGQLTFLKIENALFVRFAMLKTFVFLAQFELPEPSYALIETHYSIGSMTRAYDV